MKALRAVWVVLALAVVACGAWWFLRDDRARETAQPGASTSREPASPVTGDAVELGTRRESLASAREEPAPASGAAATRATAAIELSGLRGRVVDDLGDPVVQFELAASPDPRRAVLRGEHTRSFESSAGRFVMDLIAEGEWTIVARRGEVRSAPVTASWPAATPAELVLVLPRGATISGRVASAAGARVERAQVFVRSAGARELDLRHAQPRAWTDTRGEFAIEGVQPGELRVTAFHPDFARSESDPVVAAPGERVDVTLVLRDGGRIHGVIDLAEGSVGDRQIDLFGGAGTQDWREARSDAKGEFAFEHVLPQEYVIELRPPGYPRAASDATSIRKRISVAEGATTEVVFGQLEPVLRVAGRVLCAGEPLADVEVEATSLGGTEDRRTRATTNTDGRFALALAGPGHFVFNVRSGHGSHFDVERDVARGDESELIFELPSGALVGTVLAPDGQPLARVPVTVIRDGESMAKDPASFWQNYRRAYTDANGAFAFRWLTPGTYTLRAPDGFLRDVPPPRTPFGGVVVAGLEIAGATLERTLQLTEEGRIAGRVIDATGASVTSASIQAFDAAGLPRCADLEIATDATGSFTIDSLAPGAYTVVARKGERSGTSTLVSVTAGSSAEALVRLP